MGVWWIRFLHLCGTEAVLGGNMRYGVVWRHRQGRLNKLAAPDSRVFTAHTGDDTAIHGVACCVPNHLAHLYKCRPSPPNLSVSQ